MNQGKKNFDQASAHWDQKTGRVKLARDVANSMIATGIIRRDMNVMDFGCGTGLLTLELQPLVRSIVGVDSSAGMLEVFQQKISTQKLNNVHVRLIDIEEGGVLEGVYDLIVSSMTMHHIQDIKALIDQFKRVTSANGYLCLADLDSDDGQFHQDNPGVRHSGFDRETMRQILEEAGFEVTEMRTAAEMIKDVPGGTKTFSVFLVAARKKPSRIEL